MSTALSGATIDTAGPASPQGRRPGRAKRSTPRNTLTPGAGLGLGIAMLWFSLLVLFPLSAIVATAAAGGWENYFDVLQNDQTWAALQADRHAAALVTLLNIVMGTVIAWVLVRDRFPGKQIAQRDHRRAVRDADHRGRAGAARALRPQQPARAALGVHARTRSCWPSRS